MKKVYLLAAAFLLAGLALTMPLYEPPEAKPKPITFGQSDEGRRQALYERDVREFGEVKARKMRRVREKSDSTFTFPEPVSPSR